MYHRDEVERIRFDPAKEQIRREVPDGELAHALVSSAACTPGLAHVRMPTKHVKRERNAIKEPVGVDGAIDRNPCVNVLHLNNGRWSLERWKAHEDRRLVMALAMARPLRLIRSKSMALSGVMGPLASAASS